MRDRILLPKISCVLHTGPYQYETSDELKCIVDTSEELSRFRLTEELHSRSQGVPEYGKGKRGKHSATGKWQVLPAGTDCEIIPHSPPSSDFSHTDTIMNDRIQVPSSASSSSPPNSSHSSDERTLADSNSSLISENSVSNSDIEEPDSAADSVAHWQDLFALLPDHVLSRCFRMVPVRDHLQLRLVCSRWCEILCCVVIDLRPPPQTLPQGCVFRQSRSEDTRLKQGMFRKQRPVYPLQIDQHGQLQVCFSNSLVMVTIWRHVPRLKLQICPHLHTGGRTLMHGGGGKMTSKLVEESTVRSSESRVVSSSSSSCSYSCSKHIHENLFKVRQGEPHKCILVPQGSVQLTVAFLQFIGIHVPSRIISSQQHYSWRHHGKTQQSVESRSEAMHEAADHSGERNLVPLERISTSRGMEVETADSSCSSPKGTQEFESKPDAQLRIIGPRMRFRFNGHRALRFQNAVRRLQPNQRIWLTDLNNWLVQRDALPQLLTIFQEENLTIAHNPRLVAMLNEIEEDRLLFGIVQP